MMPAKRTSKKAVVIATKKKMKTHTGSQRVLKAAQKIRKTTKKMVDDVFLKLVGMRVLERAQEISASLKAEKSAAAPAPVKSVKGKTAKTKTVRSVKAKSPSSAKAKRSKKT